jgi:hypothetical protein
MKTKILLASIFSWLTMAAIGQRVVNKIIYIFPRNTVIDTIKWKSSYKFILTIDSSMKPSYLSQGKEEPIPKKAKSYFKPTLSEVHLVDSLIKSDILKAVIAGDSLLYVKNQIYTWSNDKPSDFHKYKANRSELYEKIAAQNRSRIKRSDKYYFGFVNYEGKKIIVVMFDPKKINPRMMGDIKWIDYCQPFIVDVESKEVYFGEP